MEEKLYDLIDRICSFFLLGMVIVVTIVVVGRYMFNVTPGWGEELALFCMTWFGMLSAALAEKRDAHIRVAAMDKIYPRQMTKFLHKLYYLVKILFALVLLTEGIKLTITNFPVMMSGMHVSEAFINAFMGNMLAEDYEEELERRIDELIEEYEDKGDEWADQFEENVEEWTEKVFGR